MKLLEFEYDGYGCYLPKDINLGDPEWIGIRTLGNAYAIYDTDGKDISQHFSIEKAIQKASKHYYDKPKKEFQCPECGSKHGDEKVYTLKELEKLKEECQETFIDCANKAFEQGQKFPMDYPNLDFFINFIKIKSK